jgi:hypothetical protein
MNSVTAVLLNMARTFTLFDVDIAFALTALHAFPK